MTTECSKIDELMMDFLYQELDADAATQVKAHVDGCARCGAELASLSRTRETVRGLPDLEPPPKISALLLHEAAKRKPQGAAAAGGIWEAILRFFGPIQAHPAWAAAASVVLVAGIAGYLAKRGFVSEKTPVLAPATETISPTGEDLRLRPRPGVAIQLEDNTKGTADEASRPDYAGGYANSPAATPALPGASDDEGRLTRGGEGRAAGVAGDDATERWGSLAGKEEQQALAPKRKQVGDPLAKDSKLNERRSADEADADGFAAPLGAASGAGGGGRQGDGKNGVVGGVSTPTMPSDRRPEPAPMEPGAAAPAPPAPSTVTPSMRTPTQDVRNTAPPATRPRTAQGQDAWSRAEGEAAAGLAQQGETSTTKGSTSKVEAARPQKAAGPTTAVAQLHTDAQKKAKSGACGEALALRQRLYKVDPAYYDRAVRVDRAFDGCLSAEKKRAKPAPQRDKLDAPAEQAPSASPAVKQAF